MRVVSFSVENFRSLAQVHLEDLGNLVVLIGKNGSGKSNVLEALSAFFDHLDLAGGSTPGVDEYNFHRRQIKQPAKFEVGLELTPAEVSSVFPEEWIGPLDAVAITSFSPGVSTKSVSIIRELRVSQGQGKWSTPEVAWAGIPLVKDGAQLAPEEVARRLDERLRAPLGGPEKKDTPAAGAPVVEVKAQALAQSLTNLLKFVKGKFHLISAGRDIRTPGVLRMAMIDPATQQKIWSLDQSTKLEDETASEAIDRAFTRLVGARLDPVQSQIYVKRQGRIPLTLEGGGIQSTVALLSTLFSNKEASEIYALEEPETHAHPELQRRLFSLLKELSTESQIFVATHSSIFVDRTALNSLWIVKNDGQGTTIQHATEFHDALDEIGARPSDIFFADRVLLVEGKSDVLIVSAIAQGLHLDLSDARILSTDGKSGPASRLKAILEFSSRVVTPWVLLDGDGKETAESLIKSGLVPRGNVHVLSRGPIESYYPTHLVDSAAKELDEKYDLGIADSPVWKKYKSNELRVEKIDIGKRAVDLGGGWKMILARAVAPKLAANVGEVPDELRQFLQRALTSTRE